MSAQKHTPGPWSVATYGCSPDFFAIKIGSFSLATKIPNEQDARLIAAAPELLQVTKDFLLLAALHDWEGAAIDFAKATLSKAEGVK
jgi:hypothetical protein